MYKNSVFLLSFLLLLFIGSVNAQDETRASKTWDVQKYDITATLPAAETDRYLNAKAILTLKNVGAGAATRLTLRISPNAEVSAVKVNDSIGDFTKGEEKIGTGTLQRIIVRTPSIQQGGNISVAVDYKLKVAENSGLNTLSPISTQFLPLSFWYPTPNSWYFARGADYAPFRLQVNSASNQIAASSGAQTNNIFEQKLSGQPFFATGNWDVINSSNVTVLIPKGAEAQEQTRARDLATMANEAKTFVASLLGKEPDAPLRIVSVRRGTGFSGGGTIFVDESVFKRQKIDSLTAMNIAESIAKMWIGNAVSVSGDGFGVIREGLPRFIATQFLESKFGKEVADIERLRQRTAYSAIVKRDSPLNIISPLDDNFYPAIANKGAMIWRVLAKRTGQSEFFTALQNSLKDGATDLSELRTTFAAEKPFLDYSFEQITDTNLLVGLPQTAAGETKVALRNTGSIDVAVSVNATTANGEILSTQVRIPAKSFGEAAFKTGAKIVKTEIDSEKLYAQTDYFDDVAPRQLDESDPLLIIKRAFDKQDYVSAERISRSVLQTNPRFDDARVFLGRALLAQGKTVDAEKEFQSVLNESLPTARSLAWASVGLGEIAVKSGQSGKSAGFFNAAILNNAEYGASLAGRQGRTKANEPVTIDQTIREFFAQFDKAAISNRKADIESLIVSGEAAKFASGIAGQAQQWQTKIYQVDKIDAENVLVESGLSIKLLNREAESGTAVYRLSKSGNAWKLSGIEIFEVR